MSHSDNVKKQKRAIKALLKPTGDKAIDNLKTVMIHQAIENHLGKIMNQDPGTYGHNIISLDLWQDIARDCYEKLA